MSWAISCPLIPLPERPASAGALAVAAGITAYVVGAKGMRVRDGEFAACAAALAVSLGVLWADGAGAAERGRWRRALGEAVVRAANRLPSADVVVLVPQVDGVVDGLARLLLLMSPEQLGEARESLVDRLDKLASDVIELVRAILYLVDTVLWGPSPP